MMAQDNTTVISLKDDIRAVEHAIYDGTPIGNRHLSNLILQKYTNIIDGFSDNLWNIDYDDYGADVRANLGVMHQKLVRYEANGF
jgi:hypothetical protein